MHPQAQQIIQKVDDFIAGYPNVCQCKILGTNTGHDQQRTNSTESGRGL